MSLLPTKTVSVQIKLDLWRPGTFNYPKYPTPEIPPKTQPSFDICVDKWSANTVSYIERELWQVDLLSEWSRRRFSSPLSGSENLYMPLIWRHRSKDEWKKLGEIVAHVSSSAHERGKRHSLWMKGVWLFYMVHFVMSVLWCKDQRKWDIQPWTFISAKEDVLATLHLFGCLLDSMKLSDLNFGLPLTCSLQDHLWNFHAGGRTWDIKSAAEITCFCLQLIHTGIAPPPLLTLNQLI